MDGSGCRHRDAGNGGGRSLAERPRRERSTSEPSGAGTETLSKQSPRTLVGAASAAPTQAITMQSNYGRAMPAEPVKGIRPGAWAVIADAERRPRTCGAILVTGAASALAGRPSLRPRAPPAPRYPCVAPHNPPRSRRGDCPDRHRSRQDVSRANSDMHASCNAECMLRRSSANGELHATCPSVEAAVAGVRSACLRAWSGRTARSADRARDWGPPATCR